MQKKASELTWILHVGILVIVQTTLGTRWFKLEVASVEIEDLDRSRWAHGTGWTGLTLRATRSARS